MTVENIVADSHWVNPSRERANCRPPLYSACIVGMCICNVHIFIFNICKESGKATSLWACGDK